MGRGVHSGFGRSDRRFRRAAGFVALALGSAGCAGLDSEIHVAPVYSRLSTAGGGRVDEALFGALRARRKSPDASIHEWSIRPFVTRGYEEDGSRWTRFLVPLGTESETRDEAVFQLLPLVRYQRDRDAQGRPQWRLLMLPGVMWSQDNSGRTVRALFPFGGVIEDFATFDRIDFALFPLFARTERQGRTSWHFLFPVFGRTSGATGSGWRFWPFYGQTHLNENRRSRFALWPIFTWSERGLSRPPEERTYQWMLWPLYGRTKNRSYKAHSWLWPFFGYASNPETGMWAWDGPWPLVRILRPGKEAPADAPRRTRFWPFFSRYEGDGLKSTWALWPLINWTEESYADGDRSAQYVLPFLQDWARRDREGKRLEAWTKLWPLYQRHEDQQSSRWAVPALSPLWHTPVIDDHYAWIYELYAVERNENGISERSWGGLWRRETDTIEDRASLTGLWARRKYVQDGDTVRETSLLFGLLRWRSGGPKGTGGLLAPAFPGPGWPLRREALETQGPDAIGPRQEAGP